MEENPFELKRCYDCAFMKPALSWWCSNKEAIKARGTSIPGIKNCPYWEPDWKYIPEKFRTEENGYIKPKGFFQKLKSLFTNK